MSLSPLILAVALHARGGAALRRLFFFGFLTGVVYFVGTLYWLTGVMAQYGNLPTVVAGSLALALAAYLAVFVGLFAWWLGLAIRRWGTTGIWIAPALWVAAEWIRAWLGWAFPWVLLGSSQTSTLPVVQLASVTGVYGLSALVAMVSTATAAVALERNRRTFALVASTAVLLIAISGWGAWRLNRGDLTSSGTPIRVGLLQGNISQETKWNPAFRASIMERFIGLTRQALAAGAQLVLWPEASTPFYFDLDSAMAAPVRRLAAEAKTPLVIGTDELERGRDGGPDRYFNTAVLVGTDGRSKSSYRKIRLVPFGEYVPYKKLLFFVGPLIEAVSDFSAGVDPTVFEAEGSRFSVAICYEAVYPGMASTFVARGSQLLTTITNDAWFGWSSAAYQHFDQAGLRAVEQGRYLVRAANTGFSGAVDPYGRVLLKTALFETAAVTADVRLLSGRTIYGRYGDVVVWISMGLTVWALIRRRR